MDNKKIHNTSYNYNNLFLRNLLMGLSAFIKDKITIIYTSEEQGVYEHIIPFYYKMSADIQFLLDAFVDDIPDKRVKGNTDIIPRAAISFDSWQFTNEKFTNPTVWYTVPEMNDDDELISLYRQIKWVPLEITGTFEFTLESIFEQWSIWEAFITSQYSYSYFTFEHKYLTIKAYIEYGNQTSNQIKFDKEFAHEDRIVLPFDFTIKTHLPIIDKDARFNNLDAYWNLDIHQKQEFNKNNAPGFGLDIDPESNCECENC